MSVPLRSTHLGLWNQLKSSGRGGGSGGGWQFCEVGVVGGKCFARESVLVQGLKTVTKAKPGPATCDQVFLIDSPALT